MDWFIQGEILGFWILLNSLHPGHPSRLLLLSRGEAVKIVASSSSGIHPLCPNRERCYDWTMAERWGCSLDRDIKLSVGMGILRNDVEIHSIVGTATQIE